MKATRNKAILRYRKQDLEGLKKIGSIFFIDTMNKAEHVCCIALIEDSHSDEFKKGDEVAVSFRLGWDENIDDRGQRRMNGYYIDTEENGDVIRWCSTLYGIHAGGMDIMGKIDGDRIIPKIGVVIAEIPPPVPEKHGGLFIPNSFREQKTDKLGYHTKVKYIHPQDAEELGLSEGDTIYCEKDSDIKKVIFGQEILTIPAKRILGKC
jgi:co-chaperonin GroES (HSP10)